MSLPYRLLGLETEYGITVEGCTPSDLIRKSIELVRAYDSIAVGKWNYRGEDPRRDLRGFTADHLERNPDDVIFDLPEERNMSAAEEHSDRVLPNGARLYNDHGHPEYSIPECHSLFDVVAHDKAGERIIRHCARLLEKESGKTIHIYKNNTDYHGASYGCHENYLMERSLPFENLSAGIIPHLISRIVYTGAGKIGVEQDRDEAIFQLSQRADFFSTIASVDTLNNRPIINTRDEPHAISRLYRRLHVIPGDANMSEWVIAMKIGVTALILSMIEDGWQPPIKIRNPVDTMKRVSRDQSLRWLIPLDDGSTITATEVQRIYLEEAIKRCRDVSDDANWILTEWNRVLEDLDKDIMRAKDRVEWIAKRNLLESFMEAESLSWGDPVMKSLDLAWHSLDEEEGLYYGLEQSGEIRRMVSEIRINSAMTNAPHDTRAYLRGLFVSRFPNEIFGISWNGVAFEVKGERYLFDMNSLVTPDVMELNRKAEGMHSIEEMMQLIREHSKHGENATYPADTE